MKFKVSDWKNEVLWFHKNDKKLAILWPSKVFGIVWSACRRPRPHHGRVRWWILDSLKTWCEALSSVLSLCCSEGGLRTLGSYVCKMVAYCKLRFTEASFWWTPGTSPHEFEGSMIFSSRFLWVWSVWGGAEVPLCIKHSVFGAFFGRKWKCPKWPEIKFPASLVHIIDEN